MIQSKIPQKGQGEEQKYKKVGVKQHGDILSVWGFKSKNPENMKTL
jgi:hypothetical protein